MVGKNVSTNKMQKLYNSTVEGISISGGDCATKVGSLCARFADMVTSVKTQVQNGISKILNLWVQTIDVSDQAVFTLKDSGVYEKEVKKTNVSNLIIVGQRRSGIFFVYDDGPPRPG